MCLPSRLATVERDLLTGPLREWRQLAPHAARGEPRSFTQFVTKADKVSLERKLISNSVMVRDQPVVPA